VSGSGAVPLRGARQRSILALLLMAPGRVVTIAELEAAAWSGAPPTTARRQVHTALWQLRRALAAHGGEHLFSSHAGGYRLGVEPERIDMHQFEALVAEGRRLGAVGRFSEAAARLQSAAALWSGPAMADLAGEVLEREAVRLEELRIAALEDRVEYELAHRDGLDLIAELGRLAAEHPLRERFACALMLALYRAGRQGEALQHYRRVSRDLRDELGVDPGQRLLERHAAILRQDPALSPVLGPGPSGPAGSPPPAVELPAAPPPGPRPAQLPMRVPDFVGRRAELAELDAAGARSGETSVAVVSAVSGTAGVGKSALAVHWAHRAVDSFPDGQLYVDLRGYDPEQPVRPTDALAGFLRALGVAPDDVPLDLDGRAALYRTLLARRRVLVLLDNAGSAEQVRPLLPASESCFVLVTSRDRLAGLVARDGARRVDLDPFSSEEAVALLRALLGSRVDAELVAASVLAAQCAGLPLAVRVAAELAGARPVVPLSQLVEELAEHGRLDRLDAGGDPRTAVRTVLSWSYDHLPGPTQRVLRLLGLHPGPEFESHAVAALAGQTPEQAEQHLAALADAHLVHLTAPARYGMHDLLREYAVELSGVDGEPAAQTRLLEYYAATAAEATTVLLHGKRTEPGAGADGASARFADSAAALVWLDSERADLVVACVHAARHGDLERALRLARAAWRYLDRGGHYADALAMHSHAAEAARATGDRAVEADALTNLGIVCWRQGDTARALDAFERSLQLAEEVGDLPGQARALANLGILHSVFGRYDVAESHHELALARYEELANPIGVAGTHNNLSIVCLRRRRYPEAMEHLNHSLRHNVTAGDHVGEAHARGNLGLVLIEMGRYAEAAEHLHEAMRRAQEAGDQTGVAHALANIGDLLVHQGRFVEASEHLDRAIVLYRSSGDRGGEAEALNHLGAALLASGRPERAVDQSRAALALAAQIADRFEQARAHEALGGAHRAIGDQQLADHHRGRAIALYDAMGLPHADDIRSTAS
jgi:DNA-binding SARP family transcriptional activator/Tfp pilus assembly protein PilF